MHTYFNTLLLAYTALTAAHPSSSSRYNLDSESEIMSVDNGIAFLQGLTNNLQDMSGKAGDPPEKYFHESTFHPHYDGRFAYTILPASTRITHLRALVRSYLSTMHDLGAETWIMHGSLLGWWWNQRVMPWDSDIDVQVSERAIDFLASYHNMTVHSFTASDLGEDKDSIVDDRAKRYLLEVNPRFRNASTGDILNVIDARWIDIDTGLFIDITTLRVDKGGANDKEDVSDMEVVQSIDYQTRKRLAAKQVSIHSDSHLMYCKDKHAFLSSQIYPLRTSLFEGVPVRIPYAYQELLAEEYGAGSLTEHEFLGERYVFERESMEWVPMSEEMVRMKIEMNEEVARERERERLKSEMEPASLIEPMELRGE